MIKKLNETSIDNLFSNKSGSLFFFFALIFNKLTTMTTIATKHKKILVIRSNDVSFIFPPRFNKV